MDGLHHPAIGSPGVLTHEQFVRLRERLKGLVDIQALAVDVHARRVMSLATLIGTELDLPPAEIVLLRWGAQLHDVGKALIPEHILNKPGRLTPEEWEVVKTHSLRGAELFASLGDPFFDRLALIARSHHERFDGGGYPDGLAGEEIDRAARITAICDVYDALREDRPYKAGMDHETAVRTILEGDDRTRPEHFDPEVLAAFRRVSDGARAIYGA